MGNNWVKRLDALVVGSSPAMALTTYGQETVAAMDVNGVTWKDLLDKSVLASDTEIWGITVTKGGAWAGNAKLRITNGAGTKIFPFAAEAVEGTDFTDAVAWAFPAAIAVAAADGYKVQFRSSDAGDGAGETLALTELAVLTKT